MLKFSMRNVALILGFYSVFLLPAPISKLVSGGSTFSSGLILSLVIFFVLASPFGIRYYISSRIISTNFFLALLIIILYLISSIIFLEVDDIFLSEKDTSVSDKNTIPTIIRIKANPI